MGLKRAGFRAGPGWLGPELHSETLTGHQPHQWWLQANLQPPSVCVTASCPLLLGITVTQHPRPSDSGHISEGNRWWQSGQRGGFSSSHANQQAMSMSGTAPSLRAPGSSMDIFVYSICRYAVCIILNLERTLHLLTGVFPAGKKKKEKKKRNELYVFYILG